MEPLSHQEFSKRGGEARAKTLTKAERKRIAKMGGHASKGKPRKKKKEPPTPNTNGGN